MQAKLLELYENIRNYKDTACYAQRVLEAPNCNLQHYNEINAMAHNDFLRIQHTVDQLINSIII